VVGEGYIEMASATIQRSPAGAGRGWVRPLTGSHHLMRFVMLLMTAAIARGGATADPCGALVVIPIGIVARAALRSESLTIGGKNRQHAGKCKCHNTHYLSPFDELLVTDHHGQAQ
jgi:hypothetical protein